MNTIKEVMEKIDELLIKCNKLRKGIKVKDLTLYRLKKLIFNYNYILYLTLVLKNNLPKKLLFSRFLLWILIRTYKALIKAYVKVIENRKKKK